MLKRVITSVFAIALLIPVCIFSNTWALPVAASVFCVIGVYEMCRCIGQQNKLLRCAPMYLLAAASPIAARIFIGKMTTFIAMFAICVFITLLYLTVVSVYSRKAETVDGVAILYVTCLYVISGFTSIVLLRDIELKGRYVYLLAFIGPWVTDSFAYITGRLFGKHKLIPEISPNKTVEGCVGGIVFCTLFFVVYGSVVGFIYEGVVPRYISLIIGGVLISVVAQIGDLFASLIKRRFNIKDYGKLLPGHGGVLDRFDSVIPTAPILLTFSLLPMFETMFR